LTSAVFKKTKNKKGTVTQTKPSNQQQDNKQQQRDRQQAQTVYSAFFYRACSLGCAQLVYLLRLLVCMLDGWVCLGDGFWGVFCFLGGVILGALQIVNFANNAGTYPLDRKEK
jgi:hypothetical protein